MSIEPSDAAANKVFRRVAPSLSPSQRPDTPGNDAKGIGRRLRECHEANEPAMVSTGCEAALETLHRSLRTRWIKVACADMLAETDRPFEMAFESHLACRRSRFPSI
jgi:hypothetical protein